MSYFYPYPSGTTIGRIDQGLDATIPKGGEIKAVTGGTIYRYSPPPGGFAGLGAVYERFDSPISFGGHTYYGAYYSEFGSGGYDIQSGHVSGGQVLGHSVSGWSELGFLSGPGLNVPPLIGGAGAGTQATQEGKDFLGFIRLIQGSPAPSTGHGGGLSGGGGSGGGGGSSGSGGSGATVPGGSDPGSGSSGKCCLESHVGIHAEVPCWFPTAVPCDKITNIIPSIPNPLDVFDSIQQAFSFLFSYRFLEIVGGGLLILFGLYVLARNLGAPSPIKAVVAAKAAA